MAVACWEGCVEEKNSGLPWFAIRVRTSWEKSATAVLQNRGYECLLPLYVSRRRWSDRIEELELPLFPGYLFCRMDPLRRLPVLESRGVLQIVSFGRTPIAVDEEEIVAIRGVLEAGIPRQPWPYLQAGQTIEIESGPLRGLSGIVVEVRSEMKLVLSVSLLKRSVAVEIEPAWVRPVKDIRPRLRPAELQVATRTGPIAATGMTSATLQAGTPPRVALGSPMQGLSTGRK